MNFSTLTPIFTTVLLAELGDKTQLATLLFASDGKTNPLAVFITASLALIVSTAIAVLLGNYSSKLVEILPLKLIAGSGFLIIGAMTIREHFLG